MITDVQIDQLCKPFPAEALSKDTSRGFELTSIKAAYIIERLNDVFGLLGYGWRYAHSPTTREGKEVLIEVVLQYRCEENGRSAIYWDRAAQDWTTHNGAGAGWSEPISAYGGNQIGGGSMPMSDAMKSAVTAGITKAASRLGIGLDVHKGLRRQGSQPSGNGSGGAGSVTAWAWDTYWPEFSQDKIDTERAAQAGAVGVWFGKHNGKTLAEIDQEDRSYLRWLSEVFKPQGDDRKTKLKNAAIYRRACRKFTEAQQDQGTERTPLNL